MRPVRHIKLSEASQKKLANREKLLYNHRGGSRAFVVPLNDELLMSYLGGLNFTVKCILMTLRDEFFFLHEIITLKILQKLLPQRLKMIYLRFFVVSGLVMCWALGMGGYHYQSHKIFVVIVIWKKLGHGLRLLKGEMKSLQHDFITRDY